MSRDRLRTTSATAILCLVIAISLALASCSDSGNSSAATARSADPDTYPGQDLLVDAEWVAGNLDDPDLRVIDLSQIRTYRSGHLPRAVHLWWQDSIEIHNEVYGMMADPETRSNLFRDAGITPDSFVVVYDDAGGRYAARFLWLLHFVGFEDVAVLNGGREAWENAGYVLTTESPDVDPGGIEHRPDHDVLIGADDVQAALEDPDTVLVDGRTAAERQETWFDRLRVGTIPGSVHLPWEETVQDGDVPYYLPPDDLLQMLPEDLQPGDGRQIIVYGLHGVAAGHTYFTLRLLGFENVRLYDGSWAEWGADPERPIEEW